MDQLQKVLIMFWILVFCASVQAQNPVNKGRPSVVVDKQGVLRYADNSEEIKGFGVNYTVPFAHAFRTAKKKGIDNTRLSGLSCPHQNVPS